METVGMLRSLLAPQQDCDTSSQHSSSNSSSGNNHHHHHHHHHHHRQGSASALLVTPSTHHHHKSSLFDTCHRKIRFLSGGPVAFFGGLVAKARRKDKETSSLCPDEPKLYLEQTVLERKLPDIDLRVLVDLPAGLDYNEWLASHTIAFFDHINLVYGTISEFCTMSGCPDMTGPGLRTYLWFDEKGKKTRVAAPQYIDYVMTFTQKTISDESIFPTKYANEFPSSFESIVRKILRLLFHVLAHLYHSHFREVVLLNLHAHLNCVFAHLTLFNVRFDLIESRETEILNDLVVALKILDTDTTQQSQLTDNTTTASNNTSTTTTAVTDSVSTTTTTTTVTTEEVIASINSTPILPENTALLLANQEVIPAIGH